MKANTPNPITAKSRLFLILLTTCIIAACIFLIIIHPEAWTVPACTIVAMLAILLYLLYKKRE